MKKFVEKIKKALGMDKKSDSSTPSQGFTLIELLVVIAIIGILAAALLIAIDPLEQIKRSQDSSRKQVVSALGRAAESYYINTASGDTAAYPAGTDWISVDLAGEFKKVPTNFKTAVTCVGATSGSQGNLCIKSDTATNQFVVYGYMESKAEKGRLPSTCASTKALYVYSSALGKSGIICATAEPANTFGSVATDILY